MLRYYEIIVPDAVFDEVTKSKKAYAKELKKWCKDKVEEAKNRPAVDYLELMLGCGEAEVIVHAEEIRADAVLIDDLKARKIANLRKLNTLGTIGILLDAKERGAIKEVKPLLEELVKNKIRIKNELYEKALKLAKEK